ncbi:MAG: hypothetical protein V1900_01480 [Candidatus Aenigmatarchaeota archaeon]
MGVSQKGFNENQRRRLFKHYDKKETLPENITTAENRCTSCGFRARYKFFRCPECDAEQK